jgi:hypothetical protein
MMVVNKGEKYMISMSIAWLVSGFEDRALVRIRSSDASSPVIETFTPGNTKKPDFLRSR